MRQLCTIIVTHEFDSPRKRIGVEFFTKLSVYRYACLGDPIRRTRVWHTIIDYNTSGRGSG